MGTNARGGLTVSKVEMLGSIGSLLAFYKHEINSSGFGRSMYLYDSHRAPSHHL
jgi:hypothetical protein